MEWRERDEAKATGLDLVDLRAKGDGKDVSVVRIGSEDWTSVYLLGGGSKTYALLRQILRGIPRKLAAELVGCTHE